MSGRLRERARRAHTGLSTLAWALRDERTPWYAKTVAGLTVGVATSRWAPAPDRVPVLGGVDDVVLVPLGVWLARLLVPGSVLADANSPTAESRPGAGRYATVATLLSLALWTAVVLAVGYWLRSVGGLDAVRASFPV